MGRPIKKERAEKCKLSQRQLREYRQWIADLEEEIREEGGDLSQEDLELWEYFDPATTTGRQIYASFTDEELLDCLIRTMHRPGHNPRYNEIHFIYKKYLRIRFNGLNTAKDRAKIRMKRLAEQEKWSWDWPEHVSLQPLLERLEQRGKEVSAEDHVMLDELCAKAKETGKPLTLSVSARKRLGKLYDCKQALELMGIPVLDKAGLRYMNKFWAAQCAEAKNRRRQ